MWGVTKQPEPFNSVRCPVPSSKLAHLDNDNVILCGVEFAPHRFTRFEFWSGECYRRVDYLCAHARIQAN
jgi:hypothetical protein